MKKKAILRKNSKEAVTKKQEVMWKGRNNPFVSYIIRFISGQFFITEVPSYANSFWYSLGFLNMTCFSILLLTGIIMVSFGPLWWDTSPTGVFIRSVHLWAADAFLLFLCLHAFVVFSTSGYRKPRRLIWFIGTFLFFIIATQVEFGFGLRGDFGTQYRDLSAADFWNGNGWGYLFNPLNYSQLYGLHTAVIPILLIALIIIHYSLVRMHGLSKPYRKEIQYTMIKADHKMLFLRGIAALAVIIFLALEFPSPFVPPITIQNLAQKNASLIATTLINELNQSSGTATYFDGTDPYTFNTSLVYVIDPYNQYLQNNPANNMMIVFQSENSMLQRNDIVSAMTYFSNNGILNTSINLNNPLIPIASSLVLMAQSGLYQDALTNDTSQFGNPTRVLRFLSDTGYIDKHAADLGINLSDYGMVKDENGLPTSWLLAPVNLIDNTILANDSHQDRDNGIFLGILLLLMLTVPVAPFLNRLPDKLGLYKLFLRQKQVKRR